MPAETYLPSIYVQAAEAEGSGLHVEGAIWNSHEAQTIELRESDRILVEGEADGILQELDSRSVIDVTETRSLAPFSFVEVDLFVSLEAVGIVPREIFVAYGRSTPTLMTTVRGEPVLVAHCDPK
jgi:hypothetical protein